MSMHWSFIIFLQFLHCALLGLESVTKGSRNSMDILDLSVGEKPLPACPIVILPLCFTDRTLVCVEQKVNLPGFLCSW